MRAAHSKLLKQYSLDAVADKTNFIDTALDFLNRGQATGELLDLESDRDGAQTMLDYWSSRLYRIEQTVSEGPVAGFPPGNIPLENSRGPE